MTIAETLLPEFEQEMAITRRVLERVPSDKAQWKPHPKSFPLGHLAQLVSWMPGWIANTLTKKELDLAKAGGYSMEQTDTLLQGFDKNVADARAAIKAAKDSDFAVKLVIEAGRAHDLHAGARSRGAQPPEPFRPSSRAADRLPPAPRYPGAVHLRTQRGRAGLELSTSRARP